MLRLLLIGIGGFIGSVLRYLLSGYAQQMSRGLDFPYGTLTVNFMGCFVIGLLAHLGDTRGIFTPDSRAFTFVGVLGGFTTFSTFGNDSMNLLRAGDNFSASLNIGAHIVLGLGAVWLGRACGAWLWR